MTQSMQAHILDAQGGSRLLNVKELESWVPVQGKLWLHMDFSHDDVQKWLARQVLIDTEVVKLLQADDPRPRSLQVQQGLVSFLRGINYNPDQDIEDMVSVRIFLNDNMIITSARRNMLSIQDVIYSLEINKGPNSPADLYCMLSQRLVDRVVDVVNDLEENVDDLENDLQTRDTDLSRSRIADLMRMIISIRRYLSPQREALHRLQMDDNKLFSQRNIFSLRENSDRLIRSIEDLDSARERTIVVQEELRSQVTEQMNERMYRLSIVAMIFLPLTFLTGLLGINVTGIPYATSPWAFTIVCAVMLFIILLTLAIFRKIKWL